ncbi:hypothetical protein PRIPAC_82217 [Pristionchus pacificus]|uniref:Uncharacterized protein n=1 Tax=Pristionchus pacificus TaxID=54126 RepID=A0A2A6BZ24_PRIPA|nr:hypothetical protein PRIPAC_82217 [Pristionchus pacificus]|eukprot:PDM71023.1 hypothetical protein PRIPAC_44419 [Pristionchus pacificus]
MHAYGPARFACCVMKMKIPTNLDSAVPSVQLISRGFALLRARDSEKASFHPSNPATILM